MLQPWAESTPGSGDRVMCGAFIQIQYKDALLVG